MTRRSVLGKVKERRKTDVRMPPALGDALERVALQMGVPKNAVIVLASTLLVAQLSPAMGSEREKILRMTQKLFQTVIRKIRKAS